MGRVWTTWPAKKGGRSVKRKKNSNANVVYMCEHVCHVTLLGVKPDLLGQTARYWMGHGNKKYIWRERPGGSSV